MFFIDMFLIRRYVSLWVEPYQKYHEPGYFGLQSLRALRAISPHSWPYGRALGGVHLHDNTAKNEQKLQKRLIDLTNQKICTGLKIPKAFTVRL